QSLWCRPGWLAACSRSLAEGEIMKSWPLRFALPSYLLLFVACGSAQDDGSGGAANADHSADKSCKITLNEVKRIVDDPAQTQACKLLTDGQCDWVWQGTIDVANDEINAGMEPRFQYRIEQGDWIRSGRRQTCGPGFPCDEGVCVSGSCVMQAKAGDAVVA